MTLARSTKLSKKQLVLYWLSTPFMTHIRRMRSAQAYKVLTANSMTGKRSLSLDLSPASRAIT